MMFLTNPPNAAFGGPANPVYESVDFKNENGDKITNRINLPGLSIRDHFFAAAVGACAPNVLEMYMKYAAASAGKEGEDVDLEAVGQDLAAKMAGLVGVAIDVADALAEYAMRARKSDIDRVLQEFVERTRQAKDPKDRIIRPDEGESQ